MTSPATTPMPRDQQFCLRWNNYQSNLIQVFNQLFQTESFVDVTLACEGHSVKAHRMVLSACSPYFQTVLLEAPCSHPVVILQGVKWSELKAIVEFIYKGEININQDQLSSLLRVAESLKIRGLADVGGEEAEAVLTSPSSSPRVNSQFWSEENPRKRRRLSDEHRRSRSRSRSRSPRPSSHTPPSAAEVLDSLVDLQGPLSRGSSSASNPPPSLPSLPSPSPVSSLANSLSSFAHFHAPMPPPGPPLPPHLAHLPPLSPLSPLLNMHPMPRHHSPEDFEIRPGIAEMIREEERAKLLESTHHWMANPMADSYQAQVQAAWQKSWNQTQSLLQNLRFRERGPLKSWRPETMADAIHAVLKEGLSLSQAARKYDIPYPTFVLYANRVHNLLGPSHEPGDMRPKGRGRPQRILLGSWPEDQIKGVIKAVVFRDTAVFRAGEHKENKKPAPPLIKEEPTGLIHGPFTPNPSLTPNGTSDKSGASTPIPPSTPGTSQPLPPGSIMPPNTTSPLPGFNVLPSSSPITKQEPCNMSPNEEMQTGNGKPPSSSSSSSGSTPGPTHSAPSTPTTASSTMPIGSHTPQSRPSSASSIGNGPQQNGLQHSLSNVLSHSIANNNNNSINLASSVVSNLASKMNGSANSGALSPTFFNGGIPLPPVNTLPQLSPQQSKSAQHSPSAQQKHQQSNLSDSPHMNHQQSPLHNSQLSQRNPYSQVNHQLSNQQRHPQTVLPPPMTGPQQQMLGLLAGGLSPGLPNNPVHMARLFSEAPHLTPRPQHPMNAFHPSFARHGHPGMQNIGIHGSMNAVGQRMTSDEAEPSPEALLFGKIASAERHSYNQSGIEIGSRNLSSGSFEGVVDQSPNSLERPLMFRDGLDAIKSEPEAIMN